MEIMQKITEALMKRPVELQRLKATGEKKIVAHFAGDFSEPLIQRSRIKVE